MRDFDITKLEDHPEYLDFVTQMLTIKINKMKMEGFSEEEIDKAVIEEKIKLGL